MDEDLRIKASCLIRLEIFENLLSRKLWDYRFSVFGLNFFDFIFEECFLCRIYYQVSGGSLDITFFGNSSMAVNSTDTYNFGIVFKSEMLSTRRISADILDNLSIFQRISSELPALCDEVVPMVYKELRNELLNDF